jgi:hypothetical protein
MKNLTVKQIRRRIREIEAAATSGDFEAAHSMEDALFHDLLEFLAFGHYQPGDPRTFAFEALRSKTFQFKRPCA